MFNTWHVKSDLIVNQLIKKSEEAKKTMQQPQSLTEKEQNAKKESLNSRQVLVYGEKTQKLISESSCLISGLDGVGVEIAKNVILSGLGIVTIHDTALTVIADLTTQFYLTESDIGKNRAESCVTKLAELNQYVHVEAITGILTDDVIKNYKVVVLVNANGQEIERISKSCRANGIKFIICDTAGLFSRIFVDVGESHLVQDLDGERLKMAVIQLITNDKQAIVHSLLEEPHGFTNGDYVTFSKVEGMTQINDLQPAKVTYISQDSFKVDIDSSKFDHYTMNGYANQVKFPQIISHKPYSEQLENDPQFATIVDLVHFERPNILHAAFIALKQYELIHNGELPHPYNNKDAEEFVNITQQIYNKIFGSDGFDSQFVKQFSYVSSGACSPVASSVGGIIGQEVVKAATLKFTPLSQWLYLDHSEVLPIPLPNEEDCKPLNCRYDAQIAIFGRQFQERLGTLNYFLVGAGALGCEAIKNYALMGVACGTNGLITVTDMDNIELSNLSRQFLFRPWDIQKHKSNVAVSAAQKINPQLKAFPMTSRVGVETEDIFNDEFWNKLDGVHNALDNVQSRLYVDSKIIQYHKTLLEGGTLGAKGNVQVVIPQITANYGAYKDIQDKSIPLCTVRNLPYIIEHTIEYTRGLFVDIFSEQPSDAASYILNPKKYIERIQSTQQNRLISVQNLKKNLVTEIPRTFKDCIEWSRRLFEQCFVNQIKQLLYSFPPDALTTSNTPFWGGRNKMPKVTPFNPRDYRHLDFIGHAASIRAKNYCIDIPDEMNWKEIADVGSQTPIDTFIPLSHMKIDVDPNSDKSESNKDEMNAEEEEKYFQDEISKLPSSEDLIKQGIKVEGEEFEKDDDANHHIDFITAGSNLRAINYGIPPADRNRIKQISGKIIPAIATTTGLIAGLQCMELYKLVSPCDIFRKADHYRNWFINIAANIFTYSQPIQPKPIQQGSPYTIWDREDVIFKQIPTLGQVIDRLNDQKKWIISKVSYGPGLMCATFLEDERNDQRKKQLITDIAEEIDEKKLAKGTNILCLDTSFVVEGANPDDEESFLPVYVKFPPLE
ncbi:MAG: putative Ubiquitin-activating enzyme E1 1 [Streblomastix strix]|uniref:Putative Ubiquitin-activating enzyme E1 1 n=1 Tax=Streblomastix strix TaxID=222440 RepID=A0A5J4X1Y3_9EUKA|nr:MAG: putative Ubiquitin-activating enzyme E1 1 [Streblomastix strix]